MKQEFVGLLVGGLAIVAGHRDLDVVRDEAPFSLSRRWAISANDHRIGASALGEREADRGDRVDRPSVARIVQTRCSIVFGPMMTAATSLT